MLFSVVPVLIVCEVVTIFPSLRVNHCSCSYYHEMRQDGSVLGSSLELAKYKRTGVEPVIDSSLILAVLVFFICALRTRGLALVEARGVWIRLPGS